MVRPKLGDVFFWSLAAVAAALFALFVLVLVEAIPVGSTDLPVQAAAPLAAPVVSTPEREEPVARTQAAEPEPEPEPETRTSTSASTSTSGRPATRLVTVVVTATRGDCWLSARSGSENGPVLDERVLLQGESVRLRAARVWLSLGAASNVDVVVDRQPRAVPAGTVELMLAPTSAS